MEGNVQDLKPGEIVWYKMVDNENEVRFLKVRIVCIELFENEQPRFALEDVTSSYKGGWSVYEDKLSRNSWKSF